MREKQHIIFTLAILLLISATACQRHNEPGINEAFDAMQSNDNKTETHKESDEAMHLASLGLVDVQSLDADIHVNLRYSDTLNFLGTDLYGDLNKAFLQPDVARKLASASEVLQNEHPELRLLVWDAVRPVSVQKSMWEACEIPLKRRHWYVTPPETRSLHNWGAAVDVTLVDKSGQLLDMGTDFDHFGKAAYTDRNTDLLTQGLISQKAIDNRQILKSAMNQAGFTGIKYEWWHYNSCSRKRAESKYKLIFALTDTTKTR